MTARELVIVGAGGSGREILTLLRDTQRHDRDAWEFRGFVATDRPDEEILGRLDAPFLGSPAELTQRIPGASSWAFVVGIGDPHDRRAMEVALSVQGLTPATLIHPSALIGDDVVIGPGSTVAAHCVLTTNIRIGASAQINIGSVVGHDARIGDYLTTAQSVNVAGNVTIADNVTLHTQAIVNRGLSIGSDAVVGSGAVVTRTVESGATVVGVPARRIR